MKRLLVFSCLFWSLNLLAYDLAGEDNPIGTFTDAASDSLPRFEYDPLFDMNEYELGPGDWINLHGFGTRVVYFRAYVTADYHLVIPTIGSVNVKGKKLGELRTAIAPKVAARYKGMDFLIELYKPRDFKVQLKGEANTIGPKVATPLTRFSEFMDKAKGFKNTAGMVAIEIENVLKKTKKTLNYQNYLLRGDINSNPFLMDGDIIFVPSQKNVAFIKGNLIRTGRFEFLEESRSLKEVVENDLGGFITNTPVGGNISFTRNINNKPVTTFVKTEDFFGGRGDITYDTYEIRNGDQIYFPTASVKNPGISAEVIFVTGEVKLAAPIAYKPGAPISEYIAAAGGVTVRANYDQIMIYKASGQTLSIHEQPNLEPGDTIQVPEKTFKFWQDHLTILVTFLSLVTTTIAISK